ncbi:hypothetical protein Mzhil_0732 [Methanosalsum zhilinae DSM 4017]|uniref:Uncharacterized protein n=1 Tax=Methanosalsum zhilinae (strain DSM 4017 / NBRC 107636 / OCM 62 / WeN5) TaxID=679901 RepID=F7XKJ5_METZD|nr:hypothetical protein [Methanosalsum zhilinae]AEH60598.1 hypothetical protein Mzhil_0732 [Methanosalsum zhilinae DSM 4017]
MGQTYESGIAGARFGHLMSSYAAKNLGAKLLETETQSNEALLNGQRVVIKSAHKNTPSIGVTLNVLTNIESVVAILETKDSQAEGTHKYKVYKVSKEWYKANMKPSRSSPSATRNTRMVRCNLIRKHGEVLCDFTCHF